MDNKHINIRFPFRENPKGFYFDSNYNTPDAIKSDILHVLLTKKGDRFFDPNFGTNLYMFLFEPSDEITTSDIKREANDCFSYCMPNITITALDVVLDGNLVNLKVTAQDTDDVYMNEINIDVLI